MDKKYISTTALYAPYLSHSGIKGQKWGIRRYQNPDGTLTEEGKRRYGQSGVPRKYTSSELKTIRQERSQKSQKYFREDPMNKKIKTLREEAYRLADKYDFDQDDGGGGRTKADQNAGRRYMKIWDQIDSLEDQMESNAREKANKEIIDKYGSISLEQIKRRDNAQMAAGFAIMAALPIGAIALSAIR